MRPVICSPAFLTLLSIGLAGDDAVASPDEATHREWLARDIALCDKVKAILPAKPTRFADFYAAVHALRPGSDPKPPAGRDIGFGGATHLFQFHGGHATIELRVLVFDGRIALMRAEYLGLTRDKWKSLKNELLPHWPANTRDEADGPIWNFVDPSAFDAFESNVHQALGARAEAKVPPALAADYELLTDPLNDLRFGTLCGDGGDKPDVRIAIEHLMGMRGGDWLGNVLRGDNPVGRVYAAEALLATQGIARLNQRDRDTIDAIRKLNIPISTCDGCEVSDQRAENLLSPKPTPKLKGQ